jgi:hypothetical protein
MSLLAPDVGILSNHPALKSRLLEICDEYGYTHQLWEDIDSFLATPQQPRLLVACLSTPEGEVDAAELAQIVRHASADPFLTCVISGTLKKDSAAFAKKSGADLILLTEEALHTGMLEFVSTQVIRCSYLPVKAADLIANRPIPFALYHLLPLRNKFLKISLPGDSFDALEISKFSKVSELYIDRPSASVFGKYVTETADLSSTGIEKRCRSQFLSLFADFSKLAFQLANQSENMSLGDGQKILSKCTELCSELMGTLAESGKAWKIINNSAIGDFGSVERAPAVAAYSGLFALQMGWTSVDQIMLAALIADLGLLHLSPVILRKIRQQQPSLFENDERAQFERYPLRSLELVLSKKIALPEKQRLWIASTQERFDGKGFPKQLGGERLPPEARLIAFSREFDRRTLLRMGKPRVDPESVLQLMTLDEESGNSQFGSRLLSDLRKSLELSSDISVASPGQSQH